MRDRKSRHGRNLIMTLFVNIVLMALFLFSAVSVQAETAAVEEMDQVCRNWLTNIVTFKGDWAEVTNPRIESIHDIIENDTLLARCYNIWPAGYVVVPAIKEMSPVKAYSEENSLDISAPEGMAQLLRDVLQSNIRIYAETYGSLEAVMPAVEPLYNPESRQKWDTFSASSKSFSQSISHLAQYEINGAGPLLTSTWHQRAPYSDLCPPGDGGTTLVGCVATAAAQILQYHQWPPMGTGSHSYYWNGDNSCGGSSPAMTLTADFSDPYYYDESSEAVAELSYEMGVAYQMSYGVCGSGAYTMQGASIFPQYFVYDEAAEVQERSWHTSASWFDMVIDEINQGRPMLYRIYSHAIVCDGWQQISGMDQYHFNYGWGGSNNAWYTVDDLHCPWAGCDPMVEAMVRYIIPITAMLWLGDNQLSDLAGGDGDGIPEGGETIELTVTIANYGAESVSDVSAELYIDDASITVVDGSTVYGGIPARDSLDNSSDPFVIDIPTGYIPRIDSFFVIVSWNGGSNIDTLTFEKNIGEVSIVLIDDDFGDNVDSYYRESLGNFRIPYDVWDAMYICPDSAYLSQYDIVIWFTGDMRSYIFNATEVGEIKKYMDAGGNFMLSGQGIAAQIRLADPDLLNNYLKTDAVSSVYVPILTGISGRDISQYGDSIVIQGTGGASNQTNPDNIMPINGGVGEYMYHNRTDYGAVSYSGAYKSLFCSFGFEAITNGDGRWTDRDTVLSRILDFFSHQPPSQRPQVYNTTVSPGEPQNLIDHNPEISWSYSDQDGRPQTMYHIQVSDDDEWSSAEMWDYGPFSGSDQSVIYGGGILLDGEPYFIRVRSYNGSLWSDWSKLGIKMNSVPNVPTELSPADMKGTASETPYLVTDNATDGEYDDLTYDFELYSDELMANLLSSVSDLDEGYATTRWTVDVALTDEQEYFWRVRAADDFEDSDWSDLASFWVNCANTPPDSAQLISPSNEVSIGDLRPTFVWAPAEDADLHDSAHYILRYSTHPAFLGQTSIADINDTTYTLTNSLNFGETYYWVVTAIDEFNAQTSSAAFSFVTARVGDSNGDGEINVGDAVFLINHIFKGGAAPDPLEAGDANCDGSINVGDAVFLINYIFRSGNPPNCN